MRVIAMYLPQFHRVKENDEWWGEGFTEWTAVKNATPLYDNHYQPHRPLNDNYYDLMKKETMQWQAELMHKYGVDGMCMYHYWFKDGRQILEKPVENLLQWTDINMPFCFCWANMTWARTWANIGNSAVWANKYEREYSEIDNGILLEQKYGEIQEWKEHFEYLLPFFKDKRYIKKDNKPVFVLYKTEIIGCLNEMTEKWQEWAVENGFNGICFIGAGRCEENYEALDFALYIDPTQSFVRKNGLKNIKGNVYEYSKLWEGTLSHVSNIQNIIYCGVVGFDETPRQGKYGKIIQGQTTELFRRYLTELLAKNKVNNSPFTFINAWNEWGEGMYLEPDEKDGYGYLEAISYAKENYKKYVEKYKKLNTDSSNIWKKEHEILSEKCARYESYWRILDKWLYNKEENISIEDYLISKKISNIAIYGGGMLGKHLLHELNNKKIKVSCVIDRNAETLQLQVPVCLPEDNIPEVEAIIVSTTYAYTEIKEQLRKKGYENVLSLESIIMEM